MLPEEADFVAVIRSALSGSAPIVPSVTVAFRTVVPEVNVAVVALVRAMV